MEYYFEKDISGCAISGIMNQSGECFSGHDIIASIATMRDRSNGLGGGFAAYGIYPEMKDLYAFHMILDTKDAKRRVSDYLNEKFEISLEERIPTRKVKSIKNCPILWRYFAKPKLSAMCSSDLDEKTMSEEDFMTEVVMHINANIDGACVASSGKNMGAFKGVGYPEDIGEFYRLDEYNAYIWTSHGRFPTNTPGWWGGAHPFSLLDWSIVHNGEITSYGINKRYLEMFGYKCTMMTDTEVVTYLFDLLLRKHKLSFKTASLIMASPFWVEIDRMSDEDKELCIALRSVYGSALLNGPFGFILGHKDGMLGLNDRIKLRPLIAATKDDYLYISSEEAAIREVCKNPDKVWMPKAGEPVIGSLKK